MLSTVSSTCPHPGLLRWLYRLARLLGGDDVVAVLTEDVPVGVALLALRPNVWYDGPVALLDELYVVPHLRWHGIGAALLTAAAAEKMTCDRGGQLLEINVDGDDVDARRFYERHGYSNREPDEDEPMYYYCRVLT